jgi:hypothetical protein
MPNAEPRPIPLDAFVHESVVKRMHTVPDYPPVPTRCQVLSMPSGPYLPGVLITAVMKRETAFFPAVP